MAKGILFLFVFSKIAIFYSFPSSVIFLVQTRRFPKVKQFSIFVVRVIV